MILAWHMLLMANGFTTLIGSERSRLGYSGMGPLSLSKHLRHRILMLNASEPNVKAWLGIVRLCLFDKGSSEIRRTDLQWW